MADYNAVIFDLDGTAMPNAPNGRPSQRLIDACRAAEVHVKLCAATGRPWPNAQPVIAALELRDPCVISAGTQIVDPTNGTILWESTIDTEDLEKIRSALLPYDYELLICNEQIGTGTKPSERVFDGPVNVAYFMGCSQEDADTILEDLAKIQTITAVGVLSWTHAGVDIHITHKEATKEHAIAELLEILQVTKDATIGVGDANNDIHLFQSVGHKVAMGNATEALKSKADEVCDPVEADGLAQIIERFV